MVLANAASARHYLLGDDERALADAQRARDVFSEIGDHGRAAQCLDVLAGVAARRGELATAEEMLGSSLSALEGSGNQFIEVQNLRSYARLLIDSGRFEEAEDLLDRADSVCIDAGFDDLTLELASIRAMVWLQSGRETEAFQATQHAVANLTAGVEQPFLVFLRHALTARRTGHEEDARIAVARARELLE
jgi:tetratricopeptide (TPR) repeat protein